MWRIEFDSDRFLPFLPEESQANPGVYGFELAAWLCRELFTRGIVTNYPLGEDWGWLLEYTAEDDSLVIIGCSSVCGENDGYEGKSITWSIFVEARKSLAQKLKGGTTSASEQRITDHITSVLDAQGLGWQPV